MNNKRRKAKLITNVVCIFLSTALLIYAIAGIWDGLALPL